MKLKIIRKRLDRYNGPVAECHCGSAIHLDDPLDNMCDCGKCFNGSGQEVTPSWRCDAYGNPLHDY